MLSLALRPLANTSVLPRVWILQPTIIAPNRASGPTLMSSQRMTVVALLDVAAMAIVTVDVAVMTVAMAADATAAAAADVTVTTIATTTAATVVATEEVAATAMTTVATTTAAMEEVVAGAAEEAVDPEVIIMIVTIAVVHLLTETLLQLAVATIALLLLDLLPMMATPAAKCPATTRTSLHQGLVRAICEDCGVLKATDSVCPGHLDSARQLRDTDQVRSTARLFLSSLYSARSFVFSRSFR